MRIPHARILAATLVLAAQAGTAKAEVGSTWALTSDYDYRGVTQSDEDPALQASFDYSHASGWYFSAWASSIKLPGYDGRIELDLSSGFAGTTQGGLDWDAGLLWYTYPGSDASGSELALANFPEIYFGLGRGPVNGKIAYSNDFGGTGEDGWYVELNGTLPLPDKFAILAHVGHSGGKAIDALYEGSYFDYSVGIGYTAGNFALSLRYHGNDIDDALGYGNRVIFAVETTLPWGGGE